MAAVTHIRFHGRGGEGVKLASRIVSRAAFLAGCTVQDSPVYGAERRGAPVVAFVRISDSPIHERGYVSRPDVVVVMNDFLLNHREAQVLDGLHAASLVLVNSAIGPAALQKQYELPGDILSQDISTLALETLGHRILSAPIAGFTVKATGLVSWEVLARALGRELGDAGLTNALIAQNLLVTRRAFDAATTVGVRLEPHLQLTTASRPFVIPRLPARFAAPSIEAPATSLLRTTAGWRVYRPQIDLARCTRCDLCFALCPEGSIHLDDDHYPIVDYDHCKGCLICVAECPPRAICPIREEAA